MVKIVVYDMNEKVSSIGSGFFINGKGHLITNHHVLEGAFSADVVAHDGGKYPIRQVQTAFLTGSTPNPDKPETQTQER